MRPRPPQPDIAMLRRVLVWFETTRWANREQERLRAQLAQVGREE